MCRLQNLYISSKYLRQLTAGDANFQMVLSFSSYIGQCPDLFPRILLSCKSFLFFFFFVFVNAMRLTRRERCGKNRRFAGEVFNCGSSRFDPPLSIDAPRRRDNCALVRPARYISYQPICPAVLRRVNMRRV